VKFAFAGIDFLGGVFEALVACHHQRPVAAVLGRQRLDVRHPQAGELHWHPVAPRRACGSEGAVT
jgi:hypothetical protein